jgi:hypothetical protein
MAQLLTKNGDARRKTHEFQLPRGNCEKCDMPCPGPTEVRPRTTPSATAAHDPLPSTDAGGAWWDVPVAEVSDSKAVQAAAADYRAQKKQR